MKKVFLYLNPIKEYASAIFGSNEYYDFIGEKRPFDVLNECIEKRYRARGYDIVWVLYPDKDSYGVEIKENDKIILTDVLFTEASGYNEDGSKKKREDVKYLDEKLLIKQLGKDVEKVVVGGFHVTDCVRKVGEAAIDAGIDAIVDLDLTEIFVSVYRQTDYFNVEKEYNPTEYMEFRMRNLKDNMYKEDWPEWEETERREFLETFSSPAYGFDKVKDKNHKVYQSQEER